MPRPSLFYTYISGTFPTVQDALRQFGHATGHSGEPVVLEEEVIHRTVRRFKVQYGTYTTPVNVGGSYEEGRGNA